MVRIALKTAFVAAVISAAVATPLARSLPTVKLTKTNTGSKNAKDIVAKDLARLAKYTGQASAGSGSVINEVDTYIAEVTVGSQTFNLIVDTGSSNTWVGAGTKFSAGSTGKSTGKSVSVSYGSGSFSGTEYTDTVTFAGLTYATQSIGVAKTSSGFSGVDGIIGFGPTDLTEDTVSGSTTVPTFMDNLFSAGTIPEEVLGVFFEAESGSSEDTANGELTLGGVDTTKYTGSITYTPRILDWWGVSVTSITIGSTSLGSAQGIVDTGTTLIYIPTSAYNSFLSATGGTTDESTGLAVFTKMPTETLTFTIGGTAFPITPSEYIIPSAQYSNWGLSGSKYYSYVNDGGSSSPDCILGMFFLTNYYSVFDYTNNRVGLATAA